MPRLGRARPFPPLLRRKFLPVLPTATITEQNLPSNHNGNITVHVVGSSSPATSFSSSTTWTVSGVAGWSKASQTFVDAQHYTIVLTPPGAATPPLGATGTLTLTEGVTGSTTPTTTIGTPSFAFTPASGNISTNYSETVTGVNTIWSVETPSTLFSISGGTGATLTGTSITDNTHCSFTIGTGTAGGATLTATDNSTGAQYTFNVIRTTAQTYYFRADGSDSNTGLVDSSGGAFLSPTRFLNGPGGGWIPGDNINFDGVGGAFAVGSWQFATSGTQAARITISGLNGATISCGNSYGVQLYDCEFVTLQNLTVTGSGVTPSTGATTSTRAGIWLYDDRTSGSKWRSVWVTGCTVSGCQDGFWLTTQIPYSGSATAAVGFVDTRFVNCTAHDCQQNAFISWGQGTLGGPGWPTNTGTFAGTYMSGCYGYNIYGTASLHGSWGAALNTAGATIERCLGHDCNQNGPGDSSMMVAGYSSKVTFQCCEAYHAFSGCGIDLDVSTTNCAVRYSFTHENDGAGLLDFASGGSGNVFEFNVSRNDCLKTAQGACAVAHSDTSWNNNTIIGDANLITGGGILVQPADGSTWRNNIFVGNNSLQIVGAGAVHPGFYGNLYYAGAGGTLNMTINSVTYSTLSAWQTAGYEKLNGILYGVGAGSAGTDPLLSNPTGGANTGVLPSAQVGTVTCFDPASNSPTIGAGLTPEDGTFNPGFVDFHGYPYRTAAGADIGAVSYGASSLVPGFGGGGGSGGGPIVGSAIVGGVAR